MFKSNKCQPVCWVLLVGLLVVIISFFGYLKLRDDSPKPVQTVVNMADWGYCDTKLVWHDNCRWYYRVVDDDSDDLWQFLLPLALGLNLLALVWLATAMAGSCRCRQALSSCCAVEDNSTDNPVKPTKKSSNK